MEKEIKFPVPDPVIWQSLAEAVRVAGFEQIPLGREKQRNTYYDTRTGALARVLHACRVRQVGDRLTLAVKGPAEAEGDVLRRYEAESPLARDQFEGEVPRTSCVEDLLPESVRRDMGPLGELMPLITSETERRNFALEKEGRRVCELSLDEVNFDIVGREIPVYREAELELKAGSEGELTRLSRWFREECGLRPTRRSKLEVGLALAGIQWPPVD